MVTRTGPIVVTRTGKVHKGEKSPRAFLILLRPRPVNTCDLLPLSQSHPGCTG